MRIIETFDLKKPASKGGGDRYEAPNPIGNKNIVIYVPQYISRDNERKVPFQALKITFED